MYYGSAACWWLVYACFWEHKKLNCQGTIFLQHNSSSKFWIVLMVLPAMKQEFSILDSIQCRCHFLSFSYVECRDTHWNYSFFLNVLYILFSRNVCVLCCEATSTADAHLPTTYLLMQACPPLHSHLQFLLFFILL